MPGNLRYGANKGLPKPAPTRTMSLDSLHNRHTHLPMEQKVQEYPTRSIKTTPKENPAAMVLVKVGPSSLSLSAQEQLKKAEASKEVRQRLATEEEEWQQPSSSSSSSKNPYDEDSDWQSNLDKWKSSRRKRNEGALERFIDIKKNEQEDELNRTRRKSKTFSEMQEDKTKRGRRYNLVVHDDDNNDLTGLGLASSRSCGSLNQTLEDQDSKPSNQNHKDPDQDNKDAKSDAGFCTGSDTGSDGVFAEDNMSDTSSALGDKKEAHDSLLDTGGTKMDNHINGHSSSLISEVLPPTQTASSEYTYDKAIASYKQYADSAKKRSSSITSLNSNTSYTKDEDKREDKPVISARSPSPDKRKKLDEKVNFFAKEMEKDFKKAPEPLVNMRGKSAKVDISKRRSMFELSTSTPVSSERTERKQKQDNRRSLDVSNSLRNKVASFENLDTEPPRSRGRTPSFDSNLRNKVASYENLDTVSNNNKTQSSTPLRDTNLRSKVASFENLDVESSKVQGIVPPRDAKFQEKLATFAAPELDLQPVKKKTPERDMNFHKKLASFTNYDSKDSCKDKEHKTIPDRDLSLKSKIASFEKLEQAAEPPSREETLRSKDRSVSLEYLDEPEVEVKLRSSQSMVNVTRIPLPTPYMVVELEGRGSQGSGVVEAQPLVNAEVFEIASQLEETPILGSPTNQDYTDPPPLSAGPHHDSLEAAKLYTDDDINEVDEVDHHYQTVEEVRRVQASPPPPPPTLQQEMRWVQASPPPPPPTLQQEVRQVQASPPPQPPTMQPPEVLDVTWTDGPTGAPPPSEPPPPPPPDEDSDMEASARPHLPDQEEESFMRENSTRRLKKELWRRRSDFLGTSSHYIEEESQVKPPPDLSDYLRQEREEERRMLESHNSKSTTPDMLSEAEVARRERQIIEHLEQEEKLHHQDQLPVLPGTGDNMGGEVEEHLEYHQDYSLLTASELHKGMEADHRVAEIATNLLHGSSSVSETAQPEHDFRNYMTNNVTHTTVDTNVRERRAEVVGTLVQTSEEVSQRQGHSVDHNSSAHYHLRPPTDSQPEEYKKLAELELEMMQHDKDMLRRAGHLPSQEAGVCADQPTLSMPDCVQEDLMHHHSSGYSNVQQQPPVHLPIQEFYTAPTYEPIMVPSSTHSRAPEQASVALPSGSPSQYSVLASPHPFSRSSSQPVIDTSRHPPLQGVQSSPLTSPRDNIPEPLPRKKRVPPPTPSKTQRTSDFDTQERQEALRVSRVPTSDSFSGRVMQTEVPGSSSPTSGQQMTKQTLLALSAIPKPKLTDNESWITKKKPDAQKRDYSKHWLIQEAEQRRLEQQETRLSRQKLAASQSVPGLSPQSPPSQPCGSPPQHFTPTSSHMSPQGPSPVFPTPASTPAYSSYPQSLKAPSPSTSLSNLSANSASSSIGGGSSSSNWRNQATTYQPHVPAPTTSSDKALPDSIIHNLTQRVNSKNNKNMYNSNNTRVGGNFSNYREENYHDYMNADALGSPAPVSQPSPTQEGSPSSQDQRLLSVSGKKKCSHCSEELGRGAAMIIESLRLFYHIPCFKCCVCGIQLGNGSSGADVRVRNHKLHCHNCYSNDEGMKFSKV